MTAVLPPAPAAEEIARVHARVAALPAPTGRRTIAAPVTVSGLGLHLGAECTLTFRPGRAGQGIVFRRVDRPGTPEIPVHVSRAVASERRTVIGHGDEALHTVEHVLAAVAGLQIDDLVIDMDAAEPPIADGSAGPFLVALLDAGIADAGPAPAPLTLTEPVRVIDGESVYEAYPADALSLEVTIDFPHPLIGAQGGRYVVTPASFAAELAWARTFGFVREVEGLRAKGLIRGASTANAVVLDERGVVENAVRWPDEFVRHKAMDCVGDLALAGARVRARIVAHKPSHRGTVTLVRELLRHAAPVPTTAPASALPPAVPPAARPPVLGIEEIMKVLPHRYPFLLVDRIVEMEAKRVVGLKNVTINEPFFQGHFPGHPIMPGVLIVEAMAQTGGMLLLGQVPDPSQKVVYFMSLDNVKFRRPVKPGDALRFELEIVQVRGPVCKMHGVARVDGEIVCEADMAAMVRDR
ncbi:bifunctional UDP-3-O-[3-hydroxymyristoyl] N-acetylglucosamine deacetylase/3-hydroxyacyl-ACP dehydratase [Roseisolibacter sp. H3M3-2]|uniref:bifunctional UDP-3-O-[3-hydroxymyristoyl] N-acetylglucosamine deacetylase/3-hydroxyacyl-ACP dehydratase n=1 Tax=Roseisolibacter sp. H3M3-2 TaxID=3031323 RepID=UPI0023D986DD|nr:bifunctional UDP-3-O-[3-hydroxymyristoyl] N-acetylglucosamine deacetylase/3-hydroxyacyl-ACP dehydratase [Roseisolibacter sp. H3M3-2]MDF1502647.1 bifunctional UDP-3-O-[3-hydroxymyristoyl] N-acetylglucosamine deacetylase/3-hydroxyacyl-ACP dehydratase [Roseisolibacter sp. H3M3-2]